jgi:5-methylcytosine-specific restriction endonuclease McrA
MKCYALTHLADTTLLRELASLVAQDRATTAALLAHIAEVDARKLYLPAACSSMFTYCVRELHMSEDVAFKRIRAARAGRRFPPIFEMVADGRVHVSAVVLLAPYLNPTNAEELLRAATHKSHREVEALVAERFPQADVPTMIRPLAPQVAGQLAPGPVDEQVLELAPGPVDHQFGQLASRFAPERLDGSLASAQVGQFVPEVATQVAARPVDERATQVAARPVDQAISSNASAHVAAAAPPRAKITPLSATHFEMRLTIDWETQEQLRYAQALLGHAVPSGDVAQVLKRALGALVQQLEQKRFAKCVRSGKRRSTADGRYVPAEIRRAVWQRDGGQCTFVSAKGRRCEEKTRLEFDHTHPVAKGGHTTQGQLQLKCRAHNQYAAECAYGTEFMRAKRMQLKRGREQMHAATSSDAVGRARAHG